MALRARARARSCARVSCRRCRSAWKAIISTPGSRPFQALAQALAPAFAGDAQAVQALLRFEEEDPPLARSSAFQQRHEQVLVVVDQFEELFTLVHPTYRRRSRGCSAGWSSRPTST